MYSLYGAFARCRRAWTNCLFCPVKRDPASAPQIKEGGATPIVGQVGAALTRRPSHRSGRAQLRHPALQVTASPTHPLGYPLLFRGHGIGFRGTRHVSLQQLHDLAPPSLPRIRADPVPLLRRYYGVLRFPAALPASLRCLRSAVPRRAPDFRSGRFQTQNPQAWSW
jgi:hypothetical protein